MNITHTSKSVRALKTIFRALKLVVSFSQQCQDNELVASILPLSIFYLEMIRAPALNVFMAELLRDQRKLGGYSEDKDAIILSDNSKLPANASRMKYDETMLEEMGASGGRPEPARGRGLKLTPSLRRGAAGYTELLQSAVTASIECRRLAQEQTPTDPAAMAVPGGGLLMTSHSKNKRTRCHPEYQEQAAPTRKSTQRHMLLATQDPPRAPRWDGSRLQPDQFILG